MVRRKRVAHRRHQHGEGFGDFIGKVGSVLGSINSFAKEHKPITALGNFLDSTGLSSTLGNTGIGAAALKGIDIGKSLGYGKKRGRGRMVVRHRGKVV